MDHLAHLAPLAALALALAACTQPPAPAGASSTTPIDAGPALPQAVEGAHPAEVTGAEKALPVARRGGSAEALADAYRGAIEPDLAIAMRLRRADAQVDGSYFYEAKGIDITLTGSVAPDGALTLAETSAGKRTGAFAGVIDAAGVITGTWTAGTGADAGASARPFRIEPIPRSESASARVLKKWRRWHIRPRAMAPKGAMIQGCNFDVAYPEVFGLTSAAAEASINDKLRRALLQGRDDERCEVPFVTSGSYAVHMNRAGVLSVGFSYDNACEQCAHPSFGGAAVNVLLATGADLPLHALLVPGGRLKLAVALEQPVRTRLKATDGASPDYAGMLRDAYLAGDYLLDKKGLRLIAFFRLPHAVQALDGDFGVVLPWASITSALDPASPAAGVWVQ